MHPGFAPTQSTATASPVTRRASTAPASAVPGTTRNGFPAYYSGTSFVNHGWWSCEGWCLCGCGGVALTREEPDGLHRLVHVSLTSVTWGYQS
jgi:hypothetical protein